MLEYIFFFSSRRRHTRLTCDWSSDVCSSDLLRQRIEADATGRVIVDRRLGERRRGSKGHEPERRQADRRLRPGVEPELKRLGFAIVIRRVPLEGGKAGPEPPH